MQHTDADHLLSVLCGGTYCWDTAMLNTWYRMHGRKLLLSPAIHFIRPLQTYEDFAFVSFFSFMYHPLPLSFDSPSTPSTSPCWLFSHDRYKTDWQLLQLIHSFAVGSACISEALSGSFFSTWEEVMLIHFGKKHYFHLIYLENSMGCC